MLKSPYELVAEALGCRPETLRPDSGLNNHPMWDSFGQLNVMMALEENYGVPVDDDSIRAHQGMAGILKTYETLTSDAGR
ncbi:MAG: acyl carrier protein [Alphaproteobacteria bacterium]|nr:acyl carrier protein [Alphaproteobacteria bacterium]MBF0249278.1 acyl carrier protein [Alphaproteobacteria bacterium]